MNANIARELTRKSLKSKVITPYIDAINKRIKSTAMKGESEIINPHILVEEGFPIHLRGTEKEVVRNFYEQKGFKWTEHHNPDPRNPCSGSYTTLTW